MMAAEAIKPGIYHGLDIKAYHQDPALSKTNFLRFWESATPAHYRAYKEQETDGLTMGEVFHMAVLEPDRYAKEVVVAMADVLSKSGSRSGKAWQEFKAEADKKGQFIITHGQLEVLERMQDSLWENEQANELLSLRKSGSEVSFFWEDPDTGLISKCRPDKLPGWPDIVDLKTTGTKHPRDFSRVAANKKYLWSAAHTLDGVKACTGHAHDNYLFVVVELEEPHGVIVYQPEEEHLAYARTQLAGVKRDLAKCIKENHWPGYPTGTQPLNLPVWEIKQMMYNDEGGFYD